MKMHRRRVDIVDRKKQPDGSVIRELECGHFQPQMSGGAADRATQAICKQCVPRARHGFTDAMKRYGKMP